MNEKTANQFSGLSDDAIRNLIVQHGSSKETESGPLYVPCHCRMCEAARDILASHRKVAA